VIIGGDFNSTPDSGVNEFMERGLIPESHPDLAGRDYKKFAEHVGLRHNLKLRSCYSTEMPCVTQRFFALCMRVLEGCLLIPCFLLMFLLAC
jgi:hypothetical protein